jgi:hypothetical protein
MSSTYEEDEPDSTEAEEEYVDFIHSLPEIKTVAKITQSFNNDGSIKNLIRATKSDFVHNLVFLDGVKFDFTGREYLLPLYNRRDQDILLKTARQVEKCSKISTPCDLARGGTKRIDELVVGDQVRGWNGHHIVVDTVIASQTNGNRPCVLVKTRGGHEVEVTYNHPLLTKFGFVAAGRLSVGDQLMVIPHDLNPAHLSADPIASIEDLGEQPTWGIQTHTQTYVSNFIVNHNTTFLANNLVVSSVVKPYNKSLYVSPSHTQTRQFSNEKLRPAIEKSPFVKKYFQDHTVSTQVFEKGFTNGSYVFLRSAFRSADRTRGISARNLCYDRDTQVLTKKGWVLASAITLADEVADVNDAGVIEWNRPTQVIRQLHTGKVVSFKHGSFSLRVTDDHRMWANYRVKAGAAYKQEDKYEFVPAGELAASSKMGFKLSCAAEWAPPAPSSTVAIDGKEYPYLPFCALLGWYLADGYACDDYPCLSISVKKLQHVLPILSELGVPHNLYNGPKGEEGASRVVWVMDKTLGRYLKKLGKAYDKHIPREILENATGIAELLEGLYRGDASFHDGEQWFQGTLRTRSKQLAEDVQEAWLRLKRPAAIHTRMSPNKALNLTPGVPYEMVPLYEVCSYDLDYMIFWKADRKKRIVVEEVTAEEVYCFTVKNHRPIVKGSHGSKPVICGQCLDEIQDMMGSEIPVIMECTSHFPDATRLMAGTPKSLDNPIEAYWQETSQNEWLVPCSCGKWNFLDETNIAPTEMYTSGKIPPGPVCKKCMRTLNVRGGRWMTTCSGKLIQGYRIPQLMVPWIIGLKDQWIRLLWKRDNYPMGQFYNEVLGISYDSASKPITRNELIELCAPYDIWNADNLTPEIIQESHGLMLTAGVDWGEGNDGSEKSPTGKIRNASYTVLTIGAYLNQKTWAVKLVKKYEGREVDPDHVVKDIARICKTLNVQLVGVDWGHGWGVNNHLTRLMAPRQGQVIDTVGKHKVVQFQYLPKLKQRMKWDPTGFRYHLSRNFMMSELFFDMKHGFIQFPRWTQIERYAKDILAIFAEYSEFRREMKYDHRSSDPDDWFHSLHYAKLASDILTGKSRRYTLDIPQE